MSVVVAGIGTEVGKTVVSAILCAALKADYWKPVQAGDLQETDTDKVSALVSHDGFKAWPEAHRLSEPMSPHAAAAKDGVVIKRNRLARPNARPLVTELAGGLMAPVGDDFLAIDLAQDVGDPIVLVANFYLGSINHTLLSLELIEKRGVPFAGIIFNGDPNPDSRAFILDYARPPLLGDIPAAPALTQNFVDAHAPQFRDHPRLAAL